MEGFTPEQICAILTSRQRDIKAEEEKQEKRKKEIAEARLAIIADFSRYAELVSGKTDIKVQLDDALNYIEKYGMNEITSIKILMR